MKLIIKRQKNIEILFYCFLVSTMIGYMGYYFYSLKNGINIYFLYSDYDMDDIGAMSQALRFIKDILLVVLGIFLLFGVKKRRQLYFLLAIICFYAWGILNVFLNTNESSYIITGIRSYLYFCVLLMLFEVDIKNIFSLKVIARITVFGCLVNLIIALEQAVRGTNNKIVMVGRGNYRFPGLFGGVNGLSSFAIAAALLFYVLDYKFGLKKRYVIGIYFVTMCISILCGSRSAMINIMLIFFIWLMQKFKISKYNKWIFVITVMSALVPVIVFIVSNYAERGGILQVQIESGRINILIGLLKNPDIYELFFGKGIGVGSNTDYLYRMKGLVSGGSILDGTFNVILNQYGMVGIILVILFLMNILIKLRNNSSFYITMTVVGTIILQCLTGNMLETYSFLILVFVCYFLLVKEELFKKDLEKAMLVQF